MHNLNLYHKWAGVDDLCHDICSADDSNALEIPKKYETILKVLFYIDEIAIHILNSFLSSKHPKQVDLFKRLDWFNTVIDDVLNLHKLIHELIDTNSQKVPLPPYNHSLKQFNIINFYRFDEEQVNYRQKFFLEKLLQCYNDHCSLIFDLEQHSNIGLIYYLKEKLINKNLLFSVTEDFYLDNIKEKYMYIEPFFRGVHQITELVLELMISKMHDLSKQINELVVISKKGRYYLHISETSKISILRKALLGYSNLWKGLSNHIYTLSKMDTGSYAIYRQSLLGTSGADSVRLRQLHNLVLTLLDSNPLALNGFVSLPHLTLFFQNLGVTIALRHP